MGWFIAWAVLWVLMILVMIFPHTPKSGGGRALLVFMIVTFPVGLILWIRELAKSKH